MNSAPVVTHTGSELAIHAAADLAQLTIYATDYSAPALAHSAPLVAVLPSLVARCAETFYIHLFSYSQNKILINNLEFYGCCKTIICYNLIKNLFL